MTSKYIVRHSDKQTLEVPAEEADRLISQGYARSATKHEINIYNSWLDID